MKWELFSDSSYYDMFAVRPIGDSDFNSPRLFHFALYQDALKFKELAEKANVATAKPSPTEIGQQGEIRKTTKQQLIDYCYEFAWQWGRFYHLENADKIKEAIKERFQLPEEFLTSPNKWIDEPTPPQEGQDELWMDVIGGCFVSHLENPEKRILLIEELKSKYKLIKL